jgi:outer membrane lipoprotein SlyB
LLQFQAAQDEYSEMGTGAVRGAAAGAAVGGGLGATGGPAGSVVGAAVGGLTGAVAGSVVAGERSLGGSAVNMEKALGETEAQHGVSSQTDEFAKIS